MNREDWYWTIGVGLVAVAILSAVVAANVECREKGGVLIQYQCVRLELVK
jgi:hypothetical protein